MLFRSRDLGFLRKVTGVRGYDESMAAWDAMDKYLTKEGDFSFCAETEARDMADVEKKIKRKLAAKKAAAARWGKTLEAAEIQSAVCVEMCAWACWTVGWTAPLAYEEWHTLALKPMPYEELKHKWRRYVLSREEYWLENIGVTDKISA